jgi:DNA (cytosine-5)-methyltransferase 1
VLADDFFSGGGGLSLGPERAGFNLVLSADIDAFADRTHAHPLRWDVFTRT